MREIARQALERYERAQRFLREGNWSRYGEEIDALRRDLQKMAEESERGGGSVE
jgi:uncharacterized protein